MRRVYIYIYILVVFRLTALKLCVSILLFSVWFSVVLVRSASNTSDINNPTKYIAKHRYVIAKNNFRIFIKILLKRHFALAPHVRFCRASASICEI